MPSKIPTYFRKKYFDEFRIRYRNRTDLKLIEKYCFGSVATVPTMVLSKTNSLIFPGYLEMLLKKFMIKKYTKIIIEFC